MDQRKLAFLSPGLFLKFSLIALIAGAATFLLSFGRMSQTRDEQGFVSGNDPAYMQLSLGLIICILGAFGVLTWYIHKTGCFPSHLGYDSSMLDNIRADIAAQDIELAPLRPASPRASGHRSALSNASFPSTTLRSSFSSNRPLLPVEPAQVYLPPPTLDEEELLLLL